MLTKAFLSVAILLITGCMPAFYMTPIPQYQAELFRLRSLPKPQRDVEFNKLPLDTQLEIHFAAMTTIHPSDSSFGDEMATKQGAKIVPYLIERIKIEKTPTFLQSSQLKRADIESRKELIFVIFQDMLRPYVYYRPVDCGLQITDEQLNFLMTEAFSIKNDGGRDRYSYVNDFSNYYISRYLHCPSSCKS